jgi:hypothetical protein
MAAKHQEGSRSSGDGETRLEQLMLVGPRGIMQPCSMKGAKLLNLSERCERQEQQDETLLN